MAQCESWFKQDLKKPIKVQMLNGNLFSQDNQGNLIGVEVFDDGEPASLAGTVSANIIRADGGTVAAIGTLSGNKCSVVLPAAAYAIPGFATIVIKLTYSGAVTTLLALAVTIYRSSTDTAVDPGTVMPSIQSLIQQINTAVASIPADYSSLWTSLAPAFSTDASYVAGQYVTNNGKVYRFNTAHTGEWAAGDVSEVKLGNELTDLKSAITYEKDHASLTTYLNSLSENKSWWDGRFVNNAKAWGMTTPVIFPYPITVYWCIDYMYGAFSCRVYTFTSPTDTNPTNTDYSVGKFTIPANTYFTVTLYSNLTNIPQDAIDRLVYACGYFEGDIPYTKDDSQFGVFGIYRSTRTDVTYAVSSKQIEYTSDRLKITADSGYVVRAWIFSGYNYSSVTDFLSEIILPAGIAFKLMIQKNPLDTSETAVVSTYVGAINVEVYTDVLEDIDDLTDAQQSNFDKCLKPAFAEFSSIGNANNLELNQTYLVYGHDVASGTNLPEGLSAEIDFWPANIYTMQATESRGFQVVVSTNNIFFRTVSISNGSINSGSQWRQLNNNQTAEKETSKAIKDATENALQTFETSDFYSSVNGAYLAKAIETDSIDCTPSTIYGVHESNIYIYNGYIYLLCSTNKTDGAEDQTKYNIELIKTSIDGTPVLNMPVCSVGDVILGNTISKCQASFILPIGDKIHIYVDVGISTMYKIFHTVYDIGTNTFSSFDEVYYVNSSGNTVEAKTSGEQYICNHWFSYDNNDYCTAVYFLRTECGVAYTDDFTTFKFIARASVDENIIGGEMTAEYVGYYGFNKLVIAYRTANNKRNCVFQQYDCTTETWERKNYIPDATARPMFFKLDNELYLANNAPYTRYDVSIWHYITANNWNNMGTLEPVAVARLGISCTYFSFCMYNNNLYMIGICNNLTKVKVAVIEPETKSKAQINSTLLSLFA